MTHLNQYRLAIETLVAIIIDYSNNRNDAMVKLSAVQTLSTIAYEPPTDFATILSQPDILISSLYVLTNEFEEVESKTESLSLVQNLLTAFMVNGNTIENHVMMDKVVKPLESIWATCSDHTLMLRSSVSSFSLF